MLLVWLQFKKKSQEKLCEIDIKNCVPIAICSVRDLEFVLMWRTVEYMTL